MSKYVSLSKRVRVRVAFRNGRLRTKEFLSGVSRCPCAQRLVGSVKRCQMSLTLPIIIYQYKMCCVCLNTYVELPVEIDRGVLRKPFNFTLRMRLRISLDNQRSLVYTRKLFGVNASKCDFTRTLGRTVRRKRTDRYTKYRLRNDMFAKKRLNECWSGIESRYVSCVASCRSESDFW